MTHELHAGLATLAELLQDGLRFLRALCHSRTVVCPFRHPGAKVTGNP